VALSVAQFAQVGDWFNAGTPSNITGLSWSTGDIIVVFTGIEHGTSSPVVTPSNANLTFGAAKASEISDTGGNDCRVWIWAATAGSGQSSQTIACTRTAGTGTQTFGGAAWVVTGGPSGTTNATANLTESAISRTVSAGSVVIFALLDWNATNPPNKTPATGSGSATERRDVGNTSNYAQYIADWVGTSAGTFSFGPNNYTSLKVAQTIIEVTAPADTYVRPTIVVAPSVAVHRSSNY
jgi:hypothetical protein